jgi:drug/metabolite transporter (DMT)-like permease
MADDSYGSLNPAIERQKFLSLQAPKGSSFFETPTVVEDIDSPPSDDVTWKTILSYVPGVIFACFAVIFGVGQTVFLKRVGDALPIFPYLFFWSTALVFVFVFMTFLLGTVLFTRQIKKKDWRFPQYKLMVIGGLTALNGAFMLFSNPHVPGVLQALLGPSVVTIPLSMVFCAILLRARYSILQIAAVLVIILGVITALIPTFTGGGGVVSGWTSLLWALCFLCGSIPLTLCSVYEEKIFHSGVTLNMNFLMAFASFYQFLAILLLFPLNIIPGFGASAPRTILSHQYEGLKCIARIPIAICPQCDCDNAWWILICFIVAYVGTNYAILGVIKSGGGAQLAFVVSTLVLPLSEFAFASPLMGSDRESITIYTFASLIIILVGIILERFMEWYKSRSAKKRQAKVAKGEMLDEEDTTQTESLLFFGYGSANLQLVEATKSDVTQQKDYWTLP